MTGEGPATTTKRGDRAWTPLLQACSRSRRPAWRARVRLLKDTVLAYRHLDLGHARLLMSHPAQDFFHDFLDLIALHSLSLLENPLPIQIDAVDNAHNHGIYRSSSGGLSLSS